MVGLGGSQSVKALGFVGRVLVMYGGCQVVRASRGFGREVEGETRGRAREEVLEGE